MIGGVGGVKGAAKQRGEPMGCLRSADEQHDRLEHFDEVEDDAARGLHECRVCAPESGQARGGKGPDIRLEDRGDALLPNAADEAPDIGSRRETPPSRTLI